jgi:AraC-like DNA-binding protein
VEARKELLLQSLLQRSGLSPPPPAGGPPAGFDLREVEEAVRTGDRRRLEELLDALQGSLADVPAAAGAGDAAGAGSAAGDAAGGAAGGAAGAAEDRSAVLVELFRALSRPAEDTGVNLETAFRRSEEAAAYERSDGAFGDIFSRLRKIALEAAAARSTRREKPARYLIDKARRYIDRRYSAWDLSLEEVAEHVELNPSYFSAVFKSVVGVNYIDYLTSLRMEKAKQLLRDTKLKIGAIARQVGFQAPGYFGYLFKKNFDLTPSEFKARLGS